MMKLSVKLEYRDKIYISDINEVTKERGEQIINLVKEITKGEALYFTFVNGNQNYYFGEQILKESIITIITH